LTTPNLAKLDEQRTADIATLLHDHITERAINIVDALAAHGFTIADLPSSAHGAAMAGVFADLTPPGARYDLGNLIAGGRDNEWPAWLHEAFVSVENDEEITRERATLKATLAEADSALDAVSHSLRRLEVDLYDTDYADGGAPLFRHYLTEAARALSTAIAVNPHR
jgi:hypothetical protein